MSTNHQSFRQFNCRAIFRCLPIWIVLAALGLGLSTAQAANPWASAPGPNKYVVGLGWIWDEAYPFAYCYNAKGWLYVHPESASEESAYIYWFGGNRWIWMGSSLAGYRYDYQKKSWTDTELPTAVRSGQVNFGDPYLQTIGRFTTDGAASWTGSSLQFRTDAKSLTLLLEGKGWLTVAFDGQEFKTLEVKATEREYALTGLTSRIKTITLFKRTESFQGNIKFNGLRLPSEADLYEPPARLTKRLEAIGDSITCGYGNEGLQTDGFTAAQEDGWSTYWAMAARAVGAEATGIAISGFGIYRNGGANAQPNVNTLPQYYALDVTNGSTGEWDAKKWVPDVQVVCLGTNDFSKSIPPKTEFLEAYYGFLQTLRDRAPNALIYCAQSPMLGDTTGKASRTTLKQYLDALIADFGDPRVKYLEFPPMTQPSHIGADYHPSEAMHKVMAQVLLEALNRDLDWTYQPLP